jgi:hypothetical protein
VKTACARCHQYQSWLADMNRVVLARHEEIAYWRDRARRAEFEPHSHQRTCALHAILSGTGYDASIRVLVESKFDADRALVRLADMSDDDSMERVRLDVVRFKFNDPSLTMQSPVVQPHLKRPHPTPASEWARRELCVRCDGVGSFPATGHIKEPDRE